MTDDELRAEAESYARWAEEWDKGSGGLPVARRMAEFAKAVLERIDTHPDVLEIARRYAGFVRATAGQSVGEEMKAAEEYPGGPEGGVGDMAKLAGYYCLTLGLDMGLDGVGEK